MLNVKKTKQNKTTTNSRRLQQAGKWCRKQKTKWTELFIFDRQWAPRRIWSDLTNFRGNVLLRTKRLEMSFKNIKSRTLKSKVMKKKKPKQSGRNWSWRSVSYQSHWYFFKSMPKIVHLSYSSSIQVFCFFLSKCNLNNLNLQQLKVLRKLIIMSGIWCKCVFVIAIFKGLFSNNDHLNISNLMAQQFSSLLY